jgi:hypothetical protein
MVVWKEPPSRRAGNSGGERGARRVDGIVEELKGAPGRWALIYESTTQGTIPGLQKRGCEVRSVLVKSAPKRRFDIYARWPE